MRIFDRDGTEEQCVEIGLRCATRYLRDTHISNDNFRSPQVTAEGSKCER